MDKPETCAFCLTEWSVNQPRQWHEHVAICVNSLLANTSLRPTLFWHGRMDHPFVRTLAQWIPDVRPGGVLFEDLVTGLETDRKGQHPEVLRSVLMKIEASWLMEDPVYIVSDIDTLWLKDPPSFLFDRPMAGGPGFHPGDYVYFNAGIIIFRRNRWLPHRDFVTTTILREIPSRPQVNEQTILNQVIPEWAKMPPNWEVRTWWPSPSKTPTVAHFHGPKLYQIRDLAGHIPPHPHTATVKLFLEHREPLNHWLRIAERYRNHPYPIFEALSPHCRGR